jgi:hypothetical protein
MALKSNNVEFVQYCRGHFENGNWFPTLKNFKRSPFSNWPPQYRKNSTLSDIIKIWYVGR